MWFGVTNAHSIIYFAELIVSYADILAKKAWLNPLVTMTPYILAQTRPIPTTRTMAVLERYF